jgi:hypothetical protein
MKRQMQYQSLWIPLLMLAHPLVAAAQDQPRSERTDPVTVVVVIPTACPALGQILCTISWWAHDLLCHKMSYQL